MSHDFKSKFGEMQDNQSKAFDQQENNELYSIPGNIRNICFAWPDGRLYSSNYAYLISCEYIPEESNIQLEFTTHKIVLKGYNLEPLYFQLFDQLIRKVQCVDERYSNVAVGDWVVKEIRVVTDQQ